MSTEKFHGLLDELSSKTAAYLNLAPENKNKIMSDLLISVEGTLNRLLNNVKNPTAVETRENFRLLMHLSERLQARSFQAALLVIKESLSKSEETRRQAIETLLQQVQDALAYVVMQTRNVESKTKLF